MWRLAIVMLIVGLLTGGNVDGQQGIGASQPVVEFVPVGEWPDYDWYVYCVWECQQVLEFTTIEALYQRWDELYEAMCWWDDVNPRRVRAYWCD